MNNLQRLGGFAALTDALTYVIGFALALTLVLPASELAPAEYVAFMMENQTLLHIWHLLIYIINGVALVVLALALHHRLKTRDSAFMQVATAFGLIWVTTILMSGMLIINNLRIIADLFGQDPAQAVVTWQTLSAVENGLGGGVELPGGLWILLVSLSALRTGELSKGLNVLGVIIGVSGILTLIPALYEAGTIFGLGFILWFAWTGIFLLRNPSSATA